MVVALEEVVLNLLKVGYRLIDGGNGVLETVVGILDVLAKQRCQGTVPLAGFTSRVFRRNLSQFHNVEQVEHYIIYLCMPTFMKMAIIPIVQRMILGV